MKVNTKLASSAAILLALGACSVTSPIETVAEVSRIITGADALNIGTTSTTGSANGLPFADLTQEELEALNAVPTLTVRLVRYLTDEQSGEIVFEITEEVITLDVTPDSESLTFTFAGETVVINAETEDYPELSDGTIIVPIFDAFSFGDFSAAIGIGTVPDNEKGLTSAGVFVLGLETNPEDLPSGVFAGSQEYYGDFSGIGTMLNEDGTIQQQEVDIDGGIWIRADFANSEVSGDLNLWTSANRQTERHDLNIYLELDEADIVGNGFSTTTSIDGQCQGTCENFTEVGGAFFGPTGEEIAGVATIDYSDFSESGAGSQLVGVGGYVAQDDNFFLGEGRPRGNDLR